MMMKYFIYIMILCALSHSFACQEGISSSSIISQDWSKAEDNFLISIARENVLSNDLCQHFLSKALKQTSSVDVNRPLRTVNVWRDKEMTFVTFEHNDLPSDGPFYTIKVVFYNDGRVGDPQCKEEWNEEPQAIKVKNR